MSGAPPPLLLDAPDLGPAERAALLAAFDAGDLSPAAPVVAALAAEFAALLEVPAGSVIPCGSGTLALTAALASLGVGPGDEVVVPALTYPATAQAVLACGARPVLGDVEPESWTLDPGRFAALAGPRVKAVIPVHLFGTPANMAAILDAARACGIAVVEDAAESLGATACGSMTGSFGDAGAFSFNANKCATGGSGGAVFLRDPAALARARRHLNLGRDPGDDAPVAPGVNGGMPALAAAVIRAQLARLPGVLARKRALRAAYESALAPLPQLRLQAAPAGASCWMPVVRILPPATASGALAALAAAGIPARVSFRSLAELPLCRDARRGPLPVATALSGACLWLPGSARNDPADVPRVAEALGKWLGKNIN